MPAAALLVLALSGYTLFQEAPLATIPEGLEISTQIVHDSNRGTFVPRLAIVWTADGSQVAYAARRGDEWLPVAGEVTGKPYDYVSVPVAAGGHVAFQVTRRTSESTQQSWLWVDGRTVGPEDWMSDVRISSDGTAIAYWTEPGALLGNTGSGRRKTNYLTIARGSKSGSWKTERGEKWLEPGLEPPLLSANGARAAAAAVGSAGWLVVQRKGKRESKSDHHGSVEEIALSANGAAIAYVAEGKLFFKERQVAKGQSGFSALGIDARGKHVGYAVEAGAKKSVGVDGDRKPAGLYDHVRALAFDPEGKRLAFVAVVGGAPDDSTPGNIVGGEWFVVVRPVAGNGAWEEGPRFQRVRDMVWDEESGQLAYCALDDEGWRIVCGDVRGAPFEHVGRPNFQEDDALLGYGARRGRELWWKTLRLD